MLPGTRGAGGLGQSDERHAAVAAAPPPAAGACYVGGECAGERMGGSGGVMRALRADGEVTEVTT